MKESSETRPLRFTRLHKQQAGRLLNSFVRAARRRTKASAALALGLSLVCQGLLLGALAQAEVQAQTFKKAKPVRTIPDAPAPDAQADAVQTTGGPVGGPQGADSVQASPVEPISTAVVNFTALTTLAKRSSKKTPRLAAGSGGVAVEQPLVPGGTEGGVEQGGVTPQAVTSGYRTFVASPAPSASFQGGPDVPKPDGPQAGFSFIPPDTHGAVGMDKLVVMINNNVTIQNKTTGAVLSTVSEDTFWNAGAATPRGSGYFDPKVLFDPYNQRFIACILSDGISASSKLHLAVSQTSDPQGTWFITTIQAGSTTYGADFPSIGFNKNWLTISLNMFNNSTGVFTGGNLYLIDYPQFRAGTVNAFGVTDPTSVTMSLALTLQPAVTYSATEANEYIMRTQFNDPITVMRLLNVTGTPPAAPTLSTISTGVPIGEPVNRSLGEVLPQAPPTVGTGTRKIDADDARLTNVVFRNGSIWAVHHFGACAANNCTAANQFTRTVAQAYQVDTAGNVLQRLRVDDPTATATNGGKWYAYPSIAVNAANDVLIGFSQFASNQWGSAGYATHERTEATGVIDDPQIYQAGLGYYEKTFGGTRNRWGDYSNTQVDPVNDRDLWTIQELANPPVGTGNGSGRWNTWWARVNEPAATGELIISEFRLSGPVGPADEFIEIYNPTSAPITVQTADGSTGFAVVSTDAPTTPKFVIPNGTTIPARGHYLGTNGVCPSAGGTYSLCSYPAGTGTATGDDDTSTTTWTADIPDNAGIALFNSATTFSAATRLDSVGSTATPAGLFKEGTGYPALTTFNLEQTIFRKIDLTNGLPIDTGDNAADFFFADTFATNAGMGEHLGAPGPENLNSPIQRNASIKFSLVDPGCSGSGPVPAPAQPNACARQRDTTPVTNGPSGTLSIRRRVTNNTATPVTRLRFRVVDITTFRPADAATADLRVLSSAPFTGSCTGTGGGCTGSPATAAFLGVTLETPPAQPAGGGYNSSLTLASPLAPGASVNVHFLLGVAQGGSFRFFINVEALP